MTNNVTVAAYATAANSWYLFQVKRGLLTKNNITIPAIPLRKPAMARGGQGMDLINTPAMLQSKPAMINRPIAFLCFND